MVLPRALSAFGLLLTVSGGPGRLQRAGASADRPARPRGIGTVCLLGLGLAFGLVATAPGAHAVTAIGQFKDWRVFKDTVGGKSVCFAAVAPDDMAPKDVRHGDVFFYITQFGGTKKAPQPSLVTGYTLRGDIAPKANVSGRSFSLYTAGNEAFAMDKDDAGLVEAVRKGSELRVEAVSDRGTRTVYHFSLAGSTDAIATALKSCS